MQKLTKHGALVEDTWQILGKQDAADAAQLQQGHWLLHAQAFLAQAEQDLDAQRVGLWIDSDDELDPLTPWFKQLNIIAVNFPVFADGRGFSHARRLRDSFGYSGELCAIGHYMQDQLFYLKRCGFDSFRLAEGANAESMAISLRDFSNVYQAACDQPLPLFRRRSPAEAR